MSNASDKSHWIENHPDFLAAQQELQEADRALAAAVRQMEAVRLRLCASYDAEFPSRASEPPPRVSFVRAVEIAHELKTASR